MRKVFAAFALAALACGGGESGGQQAAAEAQGEMQPCAPQAGAEAADAPQGGTGAVHEVEMLLTDDGRYIYRPDRLTIKVGDTVRWLNVSGFPHNVAFYEDRIPEGARDLLVSAMPEEGKLGPLSGRLMTQPGDVVEMTFAGAPTGTYDYFCTPHEALGMTATLTVEP